MEKNEKELTLAIADSTRKGIEFITKGRVSIKIGDKGMRLIGSDDDIWCIKSFAIRGEDEHRWGGGFFEKIMDRFGWPYEKEANGNYSGEAVVALSLFEWLMSDEWDSELSKMVREKILPAISLAETIKV